MTKKKDPALHKKSGRPNVYRAEYAERAYRFALLGLGDREMAECFGVCEKTLNTWKQKHPKFLQSLLSGKTDADSNVANRLYQRAMGYSHPAVKIFMPAGAEQPVYADYIEHYPPDTGAATLWLKNRQPKLWRDKIDHEHTGKDGGPIESVTTTMTAEEAAQIYRERMSRR